MLRSVKEILGYNILAMDEEFGRAKDMLFDDKFWIIRYLVVDTGKWLPGRKVIIPPAELGQPDWGGRTFPVELTKQQIEESPPLSEDEPVSRRYEKRLHSYLGWSPYWLAGIPESVAVMQLTRAEKEGKEGETPREEEPESETNLRSAREIMGYHIHATDDHIGHVEDIIASDTEWQIHYIVVDTRNWLPGRKVLIAISWINDMSWLDKEVYVDLDKESVKNSPEYNPSVPVNREYEERLYDFYGRPRYWL